MNLLSQSKPKKNFSVSQREILVIFCAVFVLVIRFIFPASLAGEWFWLNIFLFLVFPVIVIKFILKDDLGSFGLAIGKPKIGIPMALVAAAIFIALNYILASKPNMQSYFQIYTPIINNFWLFLWFELVISGAAFFAREFFFRGFLQIGLEKKLGSWAILVQALLYSLLFVKMSWLTTATAFLSALAAGYIVSKSRSIYYSFSFLWIVSVATDIILLRIIKS